MNGFGIGVPVFAQPNFLATVLRGLIRNSRLKNRILVVWSDPAHQGESQAKDYLSDYDGFIKTGKLTPYQKYSSVQDYMERNADFIAQNNIEFLDVTERCGAFMEEYKAGKVWKGSAVKPAPGVWEGGQDIAFKDNISIEVLGETCEWIMTNYDCDFYPSPGWDEALMGVTAKVPRRSIVVPVQMQPMEFDELPQWGDIWNDCRAIACARLTMPIPRRSGNVTTDEEMEEFFKKTAQDVILKERPGRREYLHHFPVLYRTEELKDVIGPYNYQGAGYDLEIDDRCGYLGFTKYTPRNAWCQHKCYVAVRPEEV